MATTQDYINQLKIDKQNLVSMLNNMGVEATDNETFTSLTPKVGKIVSKPILQDKSIEITENGTQIITPDDGYNGLNNVEVTTNISGSEEPILQNKTIEITGNGTLIIMADENYDGLNNVEIIVNVADGTNNILDNTDFELGGWYTNGETLELSKSEASDIYRFNKQINVVSGETLYFSKRLVCYFNTEKNDENTSGKLIITVPEGATKLAVRCFAGDFATFNPSEYIISRIPIN